jgi:intracellular septation protein A
MIAILTTAGQFVPILVFWVVQHYAGLKPAIAVTIAMVVVEISWRLARRLPLSRLFLFTSLMVVVFGSIDLYAKSPFMLKYEGVITNIATGGIFLFASFGAKSMIQQMVEQQSGKSLPDRADIRVFFRLFTQFWAAYFFLKAGIYLWLGAIMPLERALVYRSVIGTGSLVVMIGISTQGERIFWLLRKYRLLPDEPEPAQRN